MQTVRAPNTAAIRELNDQFRRSFIGGRVVLTPGISELDETTRGEILRKIVEFQDFNDANDPHREHDFIDFEHDGAHVFAKIDYYSMDMDSGSEDPSDPARTTRVLTIMTADEY